MRVTVGSGTAKYPNGCTTPQSTAYEPVEAAQKTDFCGKSNAGPAESAQNTGFLCARMAGCQASAAGKPPGTLFDEDDVGDAALAGVVEAVVVAGIGHYAVGLCPERA